jgi:hypothetical protein
MTMRSAFNPLVLTDRRARQDRKQRWTHTRYSQKPTTTARGETYLDYSAISIQSATSCPVDTGCDWLIIVFMLMQYT